MNITIKVRWDAKSGWAGEWEATGFRGLAFTSENRERAINAAKGASLCAVGQAFETVPDRIEFVVDSEQERTRGAGPSWEERET